MMKKPLCGYFIIYGDNNAMYTEKSTLLIGLLREKVTKHSSDFNNSCVLPDKNGMMNRRAVEK
jgi:hypothetical protein